MKAAYEQLQKNGEFRQRRALSSNNRILNGSARKPEDLVEKLKKRLQEAGLSSFEPKIKMRSEKILKRKGVDIASIHMLDDARLQKAK